MAYTQEQVNTVTQRLEAARKAGTLANIVGVEEAAKWGNKPISGNAQQLIDAFGLSDLEAVYNQGGTPPPPGMMTGAPHPPPGMKKSPPPIPHAAPSGLGESRPGGLADYERAKKEWQQRQGKKPPTSAIPPPVTGLAAAAPTVSGGAGGGMATPLANPLAGGGGGGGVSGEGATGAQMLNAPNALRQGIGTRIPPVMSMALAGLQRVY